MNHRILIALGTNVGIDNIAKAKKALKETFADVSFSQTLPTAALGSKFQGTQFHNALASGFTTLEADEVVGRLKNIERATGDTRELRQDGKVVLDLDLLKYDDTRFHQADWDREYVRELIAEMTE